MVGPGMLWKWGRTSSFRKNGLARWPRADIWAGMLVNSFGGPIRSEKMDSSNNLTPLFFGLEPVVITTNVKRRRIAEILHSKKKSGCLNLWQWIVMTLTVYLLTYLCIRLSLYSCGCVFGLSHWRQSLMGGRPEYSGLWLSSRRSQYGQVTSSLRSHFWMSGWLELVSQVSPWTWWV